VVQKEDYKNGLVELRPDSSPLESLVKPCAVTTVAFRVGMCEARCSQGLLPLASRATKQTIRISAPDSVSRSVVRERAQAAARNTFKQGAHAAAPALQASLTVSRQPSLWVAAKFSVCVFALPGFVVQTTTFVARLAFIYNFAGNAIDGGLNQRFLNLSAACRRSWSQSIF